MSSSLEQNALANAELNCLVGRRESIQAKVDAVQQIVRTQHDHRTKQVAEYLDGLQPDNTAYAYSTKCTGFNVLMKQDRSFQE